LPVPVHVPCSLLLSLQVSKALAQGLVVQPQHLALAFGLGSALHLVLLAFNAASCQALGLGGPEPAARAKLRQALVLQVRACCTANLLINSCSSQQVTPRLLCALSACMHHDYNT
jgi:hypothetical protein